MTTHERAEKLVSERLGFRVVGGKIVTNNDTLGQVISVYYAKAAYVEAVRLQEELLKRGETCKK